MEPLNVLGVSLAIVSAVLFAFEYICARIATAGGRIADLLAISLMTNVVLLVPATLAWYGIPSFTPVSLIAFGATGLFGSLFARLFLFRSVDAIGASRTSPVVASNVFFATVLAVLVLQERLTPLHMVGIILIVSGVAVISWETANDSTPEQSLRELGVSLLLPVVTAALIGLEPILVSVGLAEGTEVIPGSALKVSTATAGFLGYLLWKRDLGADMFQPDEKTKWYVGAGASSAIGIVAFYVALDSAPVVLVVPLFQTAPLIVVAISAVFLPQRLERITWRLIIASAVVVVGAILVTIVGSV